MKAGLLAATLLVTMPALGSSQHTAPDTPPESPLWWPVFDGITAEELRAGSQREVVIGHYRTAVKAGSAPDCGPDYAPSRFYDDRRNPQLVPLWHILHRSVVSEWLVDQSDPEFIRSSLGRSLATAGMSPSGVEALHLWAQQTAGDIEGRERAVNGKLEIAMSSISEFFDRHSSHSALSVSRASFGTSAEPPVEERDEAVLGRLRLLEGIETNDTDPVKLSEFLSGSPADWSEWVEAFQVRPIDEAMDSKLPVLRRSLTATDWTSLRRYLSLQIGGNQGGTYSGLDCPQAPVFTPRAEEIER